MLLDIPVFKNKRICLSHVKSDETITNITIRGVDVLSGGHMILNTNTNEIQLKSMAYNIMSCINGYDSCCVRGYNDAINAQSFYFVHNNLAFCYNVNKAVFWFNGKLMTWEYFRSVFDMAIIPVILGADMLDDNPDFNKAYSGVILTGSFGTVVMDKDNTKIEGAEYWFRGSVKEGVPLSDALRMVL